MRCSLSKIPVFARGYAHFKSAVKYAKDVCAGKIVVSESPLLACQKFLSDLEKSKDKSFPFYFDKVEAERVCCFAETLQHVKGKWASAHIESRFFKAEPWQLFILCCVFGWKKRSNGKRRYSEVYIEVPRKNGKSFLSAAIGLYMFLCDHESGAEVYCGATSFDQALHVFNPASQMIERNTALKKKYRIRVMKRSMSLPDGSVFMPIIAKPKDGASPHCSILDEYHEHPTDALYQSQITGIGARDQPIILIITTAGKDIQSPCHEQHDRVLKNQQTKDGELVDEGLFGIIYSIDKDDDPYKIESLIKANPNYGVSVDRDFLERQMTNAIKYVNLRSDYLTKHLDVWVSQKSAYFDILAWQELGNEDLDIRDFETECDCFIAVDMSARFDLTVITTTFVRREKDGLKHLYVFQDSYLPEETVEDVSNPNYKRYQTMMRMDNRNTLSGKLLTITPGAEIDSDFIYAEIEEKIRRYNRLQEVIFDPWESRPIISKLSKNFPKLTILEMQQNTKNLSAGMKEVTGAIMSRRIHHDGNGILTWNMQNVESKTDNNGNEFPTNSNPKINKKDGAVTLIMTANRTENYEPKTSSSELILRGGGFRFF